MVDSRLEAFGQNLVKVRAMTAIVQQATAAVSGGLSETVSKDTTPLQECTAPRMEGGRICLDGAGLWNNWLVGWSVHSTTVQ